MNKIPMQKSSGDLGTVASENALKSTSAGESGMNSGHMPNMGMAVSYVKKSHRKGGGDCM